MFQIHDWPSIRDRGVLLDLSKGRIPTMDTLRNIIIILASVKVNQVRSDWYRWVCGKNKHIVCRHSDAFKRFVFFSGATLHEVQKWHWIRRYLAASISTNVINSLVSLLSRREEQVHEWKKTIWNSMVSLVTVKVFTSFCVLPLPKGNNMLTLQPKIGLQTFWSLFTERCWRWTDCCVTCTWRLSPWSTWSPQWRTVSCSLSVMHSISLSLCSPLPGTFLSFSLKTEKCLVVNWKLIKALKVDSSLLRIGKPVCAWHG